MGRFVHKPKEKTIQAFESIHYAYDLVLYDDIDATPYI